MVAEVCEERGGFKRAKKQKSLLFGLSRHICHTCLFAGWRVIMSVHFSGESDESRGGRPPSLSQTLWRDKRTATLYQTSMIESQTALIDDRGSRPVHLHSAEHSFIDDWWLCFIKRDYDASGCVAALRRSSALNSLVSINAIMLTVYELMFSRFVNHVCCLSLAC